MATRKRRETFKPMLAPHESPQTYPQYFEDMQRRMPVFVSPKFDGIRCLPKNDPILDFGSLDSFSRGDDRWVCKSRTFIDIPSIHVQKQFVDYHELDGELIQGNPTDPGVYNRTQSFIMSMDKPSDDLSYHVFDCADERYCDEPFYKRIDRAESMVRSYNAQFGSNVHIVSHTLVDHLDDFLEHEDRFLALGYEGMMWRNPHSPYHWGRGTWLQAWNGKLKRFTDFEAKVIGFEEAMINTNDDVKDHLGNAKRSQSKDGLIPAGTLGKLIIDWNGEPIRVSCGIMTHPERQYVWDHKELFLGADCTVRHFAHGQKVRPRHPNFHGWRKRGF